jgi:hypothetical protein
MHPAPGFSLWVLEQSSGCNPHTLVMSINQRMISKGCFIGAVSGPFPLRGQCRGRQSGGGPFPHRGRSGVCGAIKAQARPLPIGFRLYRYNGLIQFGEDFPCYYLLFLMMGTIPMSNLTLLDSKCPIGQHRNQGLHSVKHKKKFNARLLFFGCNRLSQAPVRAGVWSGKGDAGTRIRGIARECASLTNNETKQHMVGLCCTSGLFSKWNSLANKNVAKMCFVQKIM